MVLYQKYGNLVNYSYFFSISVFSKNKQWENMLIGAQFYIVNIFQGSVLKWYKRYGIKRFEILLNN